MNHLKLSILNRLIITNYILYIWWQNFIIFGFIHNLHKQKSGKEPKIFQTSSSMLKKRGVLKCKFWAQNYTYQ